MANKENYDSELTSDAGLNVNRKRPAALHSSNSNVNENDLPTAKKQKLEPPTNLEQLSKFLENPEHMEQFGYKENVEDWHGELQIYTVDGSISYLAHHNTATVKKLSCKSKRNDCKIFFYNSEELLERFPRFLVPFEGIQHVLMVFANHKTDRITPLGLFLLPNNCKAIINDVVKLVDQWLKVDEIAPIAVTKCIAMYDVDLHDTISKIWPTAKLIGCSDQYQKDVKIFAKRYKQTTDHHKELTRLACSLCYVPQRYISTGIKIIEVQSNCSYSSDYRVNLVRYLRTNWIGIKSVFGEEIVHRSVKVCRQFIKRMEENYFESKQRFSYPKEPVNNIIDFIGVMRTFSKVQVIEMDLDGTTLERRRKRRFEMNTKLQKENEAKILSSFNELNESIENCPSNDKLAIELAIEKFMLSIY